MGKTKLDGIPDKIEWNIHAFWYILFQVLKVLLMKKIRDTASLPVPLFLVIIHRISFYISRYHFFTTFQKRIQHFLEKDFRSKFSVFNGFTHSLQPLNGQKPVSVTKFFCWCSLNFENFWFYVWAVVVWILISQYKWIYVTSYPCPWIKKLSKNTTKCILKCCERCIQKKSKLSFIRVVKNSSFDQRFLYVMVKSFLKILSWQFFVPRSEHLIVSSTTLLSKTQNMLTLSMLAYYNTNSFFLRSFSLILICWSVQFINRVLSV